MRLAYRYRLYPSKAQEAKLNSWLESLRLLYNFALAERRDIYKAEGRSVSVYEQKRALPDLKSRFPRYASIHSQVLHDALFRLEGAFMRFFAGGGYPRFKAKEGYRSFTYPQATAFRLLDSGKKIRLSGNVRIRYHRPLEGMVALQSRFEPSERARSDFAGSNASSPVSGKVLRTVASKDSK